MRCESFHNLEMASPNIGTKCQRLLKIQTQCHAVVVTVSGAPRFRSMCSDAAGGCLNNHGETFAEDGALLALARGAVGGALQFDFPRQRIAVPTGTKACAFKQAQRGRV